MDWVLCLWGGFERLVWRDGRGVRDRGRGLWGSDISDNREGAGWRGGCETCALRDFLARYHVRMRAMIRNIKTAPPTDPPMIARTCALDKELEDEGAGVEVDEEVELAERVVVLEDDATEEELVVEGVCVVSVLLLLFVEDANVVLLLILLVVRVLEVEPASALRNLPTSGHPALFP